MFPEIVFGLITLYLIQLLIASAPEEPSELTQGPPESEPAAPSNKKP